MEKRAQLKECFDNVKIIEQDIQDIVKKLNAAQRDMIQMNTVDAKVLETLHDDNDDTNENP